MVFLLAYSSVRIAAMLDIGIKIASMGWGLHQAIVDVLRYVGIFIEGAAVKGDLEGSRARVVPNRCKVGRRNWRVVH